MVAAALEGQGQADESLATLRQAAAAHPHDTELAAELAKTFIARGDLATAAEYLTVEVAGNDPALLTTVADIKLRGDDYEEGLAIVRKLLAEDPSRREQIALLGWSVSEQKPEAGFAVVELSADAAVADNDWPGAAAALQEFVTRVPNHIPALMRLVEIYREKLALDLMEVRHEKLVADFDGEVRRLCDFLGLEFRDEMQAFAARAQSQNIDTPSGAQLAPRGVRASASTTGLPPSAGIFTSRPPAKNAISWPSGDRTGCSASSPPSTGVTVMRSSERRKMVAVFSPSATKSSVRASAARSIGGDCVRGM